MTEKTDNRDRQTMKNLQAKTDIINKLEDKASKVLVLSLGSYTIKMGFANEKAAFAIQPFIAYRKKNTQNMSEFSSEQIKQKRQQQIDTQLFNKEYIEIENYLKQQCIISADSRPAKGKPRAKQTISMKEFPQFTGHKDVFYAQEALLVEDSPEQYIFRKAIAHGQLNVLDNSPEALKSCLNDLQNILKFMLKKKLEIPQQEWKTFSCIIVLPDVFIRPHIKQLLAMVFNKIGFSRIYAHLESILACLGTVISSAVVVDIGHEKINVCCVDQGIILPKTLVRKNYGLKHISKVLIKLLNNRLTEEGLELSVNNEGDQCQVDEYKQACLAIKQPEEVLNKIYQINPIRKYKQITVPIQYGQNLCISGNTIFTRLWNSIPIEKQFYEAFDPSSPLYALASDPQDYFEQFSGGGYFSLIQQDNPYYTKQLVSPFVYVPVHELIVASIMSIKDHQLRKKFLSSILVVGGGGCVPQLGDQLITRVSALFKEEQFQEKAELAGDLAVREIDASHASWLGGTVLPKLDSLRDLWIEKSKFTGIMKQEINEAEEQGLLDKKLFTRKQQSQQWGLRYLKQKVPFLW